MGGPYYATISGSRFADDQRSALAAEDVRSQERGLLGQPDVEPTPCDVHGEPLEFPPQATHHHEREGGLQAQGRGVRGPHLLGLQEVLRWTICFKICCRQSRRRLPKRPAQRICSGRVSSGPAKPTSTGCLSRTRNGG